MEDLKTALTNLGLVVTAASTTRSNLCEMLDSASQPIVALCHVRPNDEYDHFVAWYRGEEGGYCLTDWSNRRTTCSLPEFALHDFTGAVLLVSTQDISLNQLVSSARYSRLMNGAIALLAAALGFGVYWVGRYIRQ